MCYTPYTLNINRRQYMKISEILTRFYSKKNSNKSPLQLMEEDTNNHTHNTDTTLTSKTGIDFEANREQYIKMYNDMNDPNAIIRFTEDNGVEVTAIYTENGPIIRKVYPTTPNHDKKSFERTPDACDSKIEYIGRTEFLDSNLKHNYRYTDIVCYTWNELRPLKNDSISDIDYGSVSYVGEIESDSGYRPLSTRSRLKVDSHTWNTTAYMTHEDMKHTFNGRLHAIERNGKSDTYADLTQLSNANNEMIQ